MIHATRRVLVGLTAVAVISAWADDFTYQRTITPTAGESLEIAFPAGEYTHDEPMTIALPNTLKTSVRLNGTATTWLMDDRTEAYPAFPFLITQNGCDAVFLKPATNLLTSAPLKFENFDVTTCFDKPHDTLTTVFSQGSYNFYDPNGTAPATLGGIYFDNKNGRDLQEVAFVGASTRFPIVNMVGTTAVTNRLVFSGGTHYMANDVLTGCSSARVYEMLVTNGANVTIAGEFRFGSSKASLLAIEDSEMRFIAHQRYFGNTKYTPWTVRGRDSTLKFDGNWNINGFGSKDGLSGVMTLTNCLVTVGGTLAAGNQFTGTFTDCVITSKEFRISQNKHTLGEQTRILITGEKARTYAESDTSFGDAANSDVDFEIAGGYHQFPAAKFMVGKNGGKVALTISGGTLERSSKTFPIGYEAGADATLNLTGGTLLTQQIFKNAAGATARLVANGGTFKAAAAGTILTGLDSATIGENGFTIDTNGKSVTIGQSFVGAGTLTLTGGGTVTFASGVTLEGGLDVRGGTTVVFNDTLTPAALTAGKDGTTCPITLPYGRTMAIAGDLDVNVFQMAFTGGTYEKSTELREIFRVSGTLIGDTATAWGDARATAGVSSEGAFDASVIEDAGVQVLGFKVRDPITVTVTVPDGEAVVTNKKIKVCNGDTLVFDIGADGSFASDYPVVSGAILVKRGEGTLTLGNANNNFASVTNEAGTIVLKDPNALGGLTVPISGDGIVYDFATPGETASTFTICKPYSNEAICVDIPTADVTMPLYDILNGGLVKDGPGAVIFMMPDNNVRLSIANATPWKGNKQGDAGVKIRQGELAFRGRTETIRELTYTDMSPSIGVTNDLGVANPAVPKLVFDHICFSATRVTPTFCAVGVKSAGPAQLIVTNSATVALNSINVGSTTASSTDKAYVTIDDNSILRFSYRLTALPNGGMVYFDVDNNSALQIAGTDLRGNVDMTFRNGSQLCNNSGGLLSLAYGVADHTTSFRFESGSQMLVSYIGESGKDKTSLQSICKLLFDGGEWCPGADTVTLGFTRITGELAVKDSGLILAPTEGQTWTIGAPIVDSAEGAGGLVKRGEGTVILDAANLKYTGVTRLEAGTLDLNGSTAEGVTIQPAGGTMTNGSLVKPTYKLEVTDEGQAETKATIDPSVVSGVVTFDLGRTAENPLTLPVAAFEVATYTGDSAPDVSMWKVTGTGRADAVTTLTVDTTTKQIKASVSQLEGFFLFLQ